MKNRKCCGIVSLFLLSALCAALLAGCGMKAEKEPYRLEENEGRGAASYPYVVHTRSATWYLAKADMELLGEEAFLEGFRRLVENQEADFADAREALRGYLREEIPPVEIYTDFSGKAEESRYEGGYYYGNDRSIRLFTDWNAAGYCLMHEYVHYLSFSCTDTPVENSFWAEGLADYVSKILCKNRMAHAVLREQDSEETRFLIERGVADPQTGEFDLRRYTYGMAEMINHEAYVGEKYFAISAALMTVREDRLEHLTASSLSYPEAACMVEYLVETYGRDAVFSRFSIGETEMKDAFGKSFRELYDDWRARNLARCEELGLDLSVAK